MIVIGTAGHIDHGKSAIVKRLTGTDPDRLPEEKARGMTIDLGFAFYRTPDGQDIALVDVPGHERFVKNMIAGAGGIDAVVLVVAADDGWMPQSQEHFEIVQLLGVRHGFIVINKSDLADQDWLDLLEQDIHDRVQHSFLAGAPIFRVSALKGDGFADLIDYLNQLPGQIESKKDIGKARLYVDRSFVRPGMGGVVTGTLRGGTLAVGQPISVWPPIEIGKIRSLQSKGEDVQTVGPGHRTAAAVTGVDKELLIRGGVISDRLDVSYFRENQILALSLQLLRDAPVPIEDRRRVLVILGTSEVEGEMRIFESKEILPGGQGIVFFRPDDPLYSLVGDRYIVRLPSPTVTLGGGMVLDHLPAFPRRKELASLHYLQGRLSGKLPDIIMTELQKQVFAPADSFLRDADFSAKDAVSEVNRLISEKLAGKFNDSFYLQSELSQVSGRFKQSLTEHLKEHPHLKGLAIEQLLDVSPYDQRVSRALIEYLLDIGELVKLGDKYNLVGRGMSLKGVIKEAHDEIMSELRAAPHAPPTLATLAAGGKSHQEAIKYIIESGEGYKCGSEFLFLREVWAEVVNWIRAKLASDGTFAVTDLRDKFGFSRKYAIPILEEADRIRLTSRQGDIRVKGDRFESEDSIL